MELEKEKLEVLQGIEQGLQEANNLAWFMLEVKKVELQILEKRFLQSSFMSNHFLLTPGTV